MRKREREGERESSSTTSNQTVKHENMRTWRYMYMRCTVLCWYLDKVGSHGDGGVIHQ